MSDIVTPCHTNECRSRKKKITLSEWDENIFESFLQVLLSSTGKQNISVRQDITKENSILSSQKRNANAWVHLSNSEKQNLYIEVLYTIKHKIGSTCGGHSPFIQDLFEFAQKIFGISDSEHRSLLIAASEEKPPIVVLNVTVIQARDLEAKDADGFSDPYVMLGIIPGKRMNENITEDSDPSSDYLNSDNNSMNCSRDKSPRRMKNFGKSLRKKVGGSEKHLNIKSTSNVEKKSPNKGIGYRESIPAKFIQTTSVKPNTMTPIWNELFRFDIENVRNDKLHLDIWDHDDEESVFDAVKKLNEVKGVKGLSRYFKQVGQSARTSSGDVDDFLGCLTVDLDKIPSIGKKEWFKLEGRNPKSRAEGEIELELKLSTREDRNFSEENNWLDILQHEDLLKIFIKYELQFLKDGSKSWNGEMREEAETILHQHAIQGDMTELQILVCRWLVLTEIYRVDDLNPKVLHDLLKKMEHKWQPGFLSRNEMNLLATSFSHFIEHCLGKLKHFRYNFPIENEFYSNQLKELLRILTTLSSSSLYRAVSPFENELSSQLMSVIKKSATDVLENTIVSITLELENVKNGDYKELMKYVKLTSIINRDLYDVEKFYNDIFAKEVNIKLFQLNYKVYVKKINKLVIENNHLSNLAVELDSMIQNFDSFECYRVLIDFFTMLVNLQQFYSYQDVLVTDDFGSFDNMDYYSWFKPILEKWIDFSKYKLEKKIEYLIDFDEMKLISDSQMLSSVSASNVSTAFEVIEHTWKRIQWSDITGKVNYVTLLTQALGSCGLLYADTLHEKVRLAGYFDECGQFDLSRQVCIALNNINHIDQYLGRIPMDLAFDQLANEVAYSSGDKQAGKTLLETMLLIIQQSRDHISGVIQNIIQRVTGKMRPEIRKNIFHLCWSPQSVNVEKASSDLITYLYENISTVKIQLHSAIYSNVISGIWSEVLAQIIEQANKEVDENENENSEEKSDNYFVIQRLYKCLDILLKFFLGVDDNIALSSLETQQFETAKYLLKLYTSTTKEIVEYYFKEKLIEQNDSMINRVYGSINTKIYYKRCSGTLVVEIINANDLIPLDSNGLSDPFVIIELAPSHYFSQSFKSMKTKIVKNSLNPEFNEVFEIQVKLDQITKSGATLVLTIMDHDMLMTDDLEGLVFVNLNNIQGISTELSKNTIIKSVSYPIVLPKYEVNKALFVLEKRKSDLYANENLKKWLPIEKSVN